jgi:aminoglycoside phosphotransferase (APT) family kinase protein
VGSFADVGNRVASLGGWARVLGTPDDPMPGARDASPGQLTGRVLMSPPRRDDHSLSGSAAVGTAFPSTVEELTPEVVGGVLASRHPGVVVEAVEIVSTKRCGDGVASTADRVTIALTYAPGTGEGLPEQLVVKTMLARPHAPAAMYENEVRFYGEIRPELTIEAPTVYGTSFDRATGRFGLLLEDLTVRAASFPSALSPVSLAQIRSLIGHLAALHATYWQSPRFATDLAWVGTPTTGGMADVFISIGLELIEDQVARYPFKAELIAPLGRSVADMWGPLWAVQASHTDDPTTLLHGDPHIGNTYLLPGDTGGLLDWQLMVRGSWAHDVTYLLVTGLDTETRRAHQHALLAEYLDLLGALGVPDPPSFGDAFSRMRRAALWGLVIGWLICPPENYGPDITIANIARTVAAVEDLETFAAIDQAFL